MDDATTLYTFALHCPHPVFAIQLLGSWDHFKTKYPMVRDTAKGSGHWTGCHSFEDIVRDGSCDKRGPPGNGGLKMGGTYWYYYLLTLLDDEIEYHDLTLPLTKSCPILSGQVVNVMEVPIELGPESVYPPRGFSLTKILKTMDPRDRYRNPKPLTSESLLPATPLSARSIANLDIPRSRRCRAPGASLDEAKESTGAGKRFPRRAAVGLKSNPLRLNRGSRSDCHGARLSPGRRVSTSYTANETAITSEHRRTSTAPVTVSTWGASEVQSELSPEPLASRFDVFMSMFSRKWKRRSVTSGPHTEGHNSHTTNSSVSSQSSDRTSHDHRYARCGSIQDLRLEAAVLGKNEQQSPSLTYSSFESPNFNDSPHRHRHPAPLGFDLDHAGGHPSAGTANAMTDNEYRPCPPCLHIDTTSYDIARTPAYISPAAPPIPPQSCYATTWPSPRDGFSSTMASTEHVDHQSPASLDCNSSPLKWDSGIELLCEDTPCLDDLTSELSYLGGVII